MEKLDTMFNPCMAWGVVSYIQGVPYNKVLRWIDKKNYNF